MKSIMFLAVLALTSGAQGASLTVPLPDGCTPAVAGYTVACAGVPQPPPPPLPPPPSPAPGCAGFGISPMEATWPLQANTHGNLGFFGPMIALVIHFRSGGVGETASFNIQNTTGPNYNIVVASISASPGCNVARQYPAVLPILYVASASQTPTMKMVVGVPILGYPVSLQPNTDYWITVVNRLPSAGSWPGINTCPRTDCGTGRRIDFNTN